MFARLPAIPFIKLSFGTRSIKTRFLFGDPSGNRTHDYAVRGRRLSRLTMGPYWLLAYYNTAKRKNQPLFSIFLKNFFEGAEKGEIGLQYAAKACIINRIKAKGERYA